MHKEGFDIAVPARTFGLHLAAERRYLLFPSISLALEQLFYHPNKTAGQNKIER
jgi:hypothetical protein